MLQEIYNHWHLNFKTKLFSTAVTSYHSPCYRCIRHKIEYFWQYRAEIMQNLKSAPESLQHWGTPKSRWKHLLTTQYVLPSKALPQGVTFTKTIKTTLTTSSLTCNSNSWISKRKMASQINGMLKWVTLPIYSLCLDLDIVLPIPTKYPCKDTE